jgi:hypothetical protein
MKEEHRLRAVGHFEVLGQLSNQKEGWHCDAQKYQLGQKSPCHCGILFCEGAWTGTASCSLIG